MTIELPPITDDDRQFLHYNPNTSDIVEWVHNYARVAVDNCIAAEREACAKLVEARQDFKEEVRLILAAAKTLDDGDSDSTLSRLRHERTVMLMNNALAFAADDIRKRSNVRLPTS